MSGVTVLGEQYRHKARERFPRSSPLDLGQHRLGLREPERHRHGLVQIDSSGEFGLGLLWPPGLDIQLSLSRFMVIYLSRSIYRGL
jgi:hypothetical protein